MFNTQDAIDALKTTLKSYEIAEEKEVLAIRQKYDEKRQTLGSAIGLNTETASTEKTEGSDFPPKKAS